jgi:hypothetical protein
VGFTLIAVLATTSRASADNTTAGNARFLMMGETQSQTLSSTVTSRWYKANLTAGRSYAVYVWAPFTDASIEAPSIQNIGFFTDAGVTAAPGVDLSEQEVDIDVSGFNHEQTKIIPTTSGTFWIEVPVVSTPTNAYTIHVMLMETTLFSSWYFVSAPSGYNGYITIRNNASTSVSATVTVYSAAGAVLGTSTISIPGNGNTFVLASSLGATSSGSAQIAHNGPPGAITANITTLSAMTGLSFDAPFGPRMQWSVIGNP